MKITKQQVKDCYENKELLKEFFPSAFNQKLEVGKWYVNNNYGSIFNFNGMYDLEKSPLGYGITNKKLWHDENETGWSVKNLREATREEVEKALIAEAEKRGFKEGVTVAVKGINDFMGSTPAPICGKFQYNEYVNVLECYRGNGHIFEKGKWAEIIQETEIELTLDQIAEKFGVDKVKIKKE